VLQAELAEASTTTLADARALTTCKLGVPTMPYIAEQKLYAWVVIMRLFHGEAAPIVVNSQSMVAVVGPQMHAIVAQCGGSTRKGIELMCRVLYEVQQDYYMWLGQTANARNPAELAAIPTPTYSGLINAVLSQRVESLGGLPGWILGKLPPEDAPNVSLRGLRVREREEDIRYGENPDADRRVKRRFADSSFNSISDMLANGGSDVKIPKYGGKEICMSWAVKGACGKGCKRAKQHQPYSRSITNQLMELMDKCGVPAFDG
jgi:hypothetical protein